jgi:type IV fimbrial biogenesis protein FimT
MRDGLRQLQVIVTQLELIMNMRIFSGKSGFQTGRNCQMPCHPISNYSFTENCLTHFVGHTTPFVGHKGAFIYPFVCINISSVRNCQKYGGFTLVEMIIVLVLIGVSVSLAIPAFRTFIENQRIATQLNDFRADVELALSEAGKRPLPVVLCPASAGACAPGATSLTTGWIIFEDTNRNGTYDAVASEPLVKQRDGLTSPELRFVNLNTNAVNSITFTSLRTVPAAANATVGPPISGLPNSNSVFYMLCDKRDPPGNVARHARLISITLTGQIQIRTLPDPALPGLQCPAS